MLKNSSFLQKISFAAFLVLLSAFSVVAQNLRGDLDKSFIKYDVVRLDKQAARRRVERGRTLSMPAAGKTFALALTPRDLRAAVYRAEDAGPMGARRIEPGAVTTFKGKIEGAADSEVRLTIDDEKIEGFFEANGERFFIEPARNYSEAAAADEFVVYREADATGAAVCDLAEKIERGRELAAANLANAAAAPLAFRVIEIATDADFQYLAVFGNDAARANGEIQSILNMAEPVYERELGLTFSIVFQHTWTTGDPFNGIDRPSLLTSFQNYWNANFPATQIRRDIAHLFTGKTFARGGGYAYIGEACDPVNGYGLSGYVDFQSGQVLVTAHEIGHNLGANHVDTGDCANTIMNANLTGSTPLTFCAFSRTEIANYVNAGGSCLTVPSTARFDFDGDGRAELSIFRPTFGEWWYLRSSDGQNRAFQFGNGNDRLVPADYTGDGKTDVAIFRSSTGEWFVLRSEDQSFYSFPFGLGSDVPAPGDYDGDAKTDPAVLRPSTATRFIMKSTGGTLIQQFGTSEDIPVVADYDNDDRDDIAIFRPSSGQWWLSRSRAGLIAFQFGNRSDKPAPGDYTGDGAADVALWRPSTGEWFVLRSENQSFYSFPFGTGGDIPAPADYDGDGRFDAAVFRPLTSTWFVQRTSSTTLIQNFGIVGDRPVPSVFIP
jgi:hypothetical protein